MTVKCDWTRLSFQPRYILKIYSRSLITPPTLETFSLLDGPHSAETLCLVDPTFSTDCCNVQEVSPPSTLAAAVAASVVLLAGSQNANLFSRGRF